MKKLEAYQNAINDIDDFFEYQYKSYSNKETKSFIDTVMLKLVRNLLKGENNDD